MTAWAVHGVELPYGEEAGLWWVDASGSLHDRPVLGAEHLPGGYFLAGLVDAHAHPGVGAGPAGLVPLDRASARANLIAWAQGGITLVRDVGSPRGLTLEMHSEAGMPEVRAAGRFLAPRDRYFPGLLGVPVEEPELVSAALAEVGRGARWVKVIADFRDLAAGGVEAEPTYPIESIARLVAAVHEAGARIAVHSTLADAGQLVAAGVDSVEHGFGLDEAAVTEMARRGTAWTPTIGALLALLDSPGMPPEHRARLQQGRERVAELLPLAVWLGVPVLAGTDVTGSIPREVAMLTRMGLAPNDALAAASVWPRQFIGADATTADVVTYHHDPRDDPDQLRDPAAVVAGGTRLR
jgi:imidazolonepropionase-like amidohydrolase